MSSFSQRKDILKAQLGLNAKFLTTLIFFINNIALMAQSIPLYSEILTTYQFNPFPQQSTGSIQYNVYLQNTASIFTLTPIPATCNTKNDVIQVQNEIGNKYFGLEYISFSLKFTEQYDFLKVDLSFIKFRQWGTENVSFIVDQIESTFAGDIQGNPNKFCNNYQGNSTVYPFSKTFIPNSINNINLVIKSRASIPEREWSINSLTFYLYKDCPNGYYKGQGVCYQCINGCTSCLSNDTCQVCADSKRDVQSKCVNCLSDYKLDSNQNCIICQIQDCNVYEQSLNCNCIELTPLGKCKQQNSQCQQFNNLDKCTCQSCKSGLYISSDQLRCVRSCGLGYTVKDSTSCVKCSDNCSTCTFVNSNLECLTCYNQYYLSNKMCTSACLSNQFIYNQMECRDCDSSCQTCIQCNQCIDNTNSICTNCNLNMTKLNLYSIGTYFFCYSNDQPSIKCQLTKSYKYLLVDQNNNNLMCLHDCMGNQQKTLQNKPTNTCLLCSDTNCSQCNFDFKQCQKCKTGYLLQDYNCVQQCSATYYNINQKYCVQDCGTGYRKDESIQSCKQCSPYCSSCNNNACLQCNPNYYLDNNSNCVQNCIDGYFKDTTKCTQCQSPCLTCSSITQCISCKQNQFILNQQCLNTCPSTQQYAYYNTCKSQCPDGYYANESTKQCMLCDQVQNCQKCTLNSNGQICLQCKIGSYMNKSNNNCVSTCPDKTFANPSNQMCDSCLQQCKTCLNGDSCSSCPPETFLLTINSIQTCSVCPNQQYFDGNQCSSQCSTGYAAINNYNARQCLACQDSLCQKCSITGEATLQKCQQCKTGYFLLEELNSCLITCPDQMYNDISTSTCKKCSESCNNCIMSFDNCSTCRQGMYLQDNGNTKQCVSTCLDTYYLKDNACKKCSQSNCLHCDDNNCYKCDSNSLLVANSCILCPSEIYLVDKNCQFCVNSYLNLDLQSCVVKDNCNNGYYIEQRICKKCDIGVICDKVSTADQIANCNNLCSDCNTGLYLEGAFCKACPTGCLQCIAGGVCTNCDTNYCNVQGQCLKLDDKIKSCDQINTSVCKPLNSDGICLQCLINFPSQCLICDPNSYLFSSGCVLKCPDRMVRDRNKYDYKNIYSGICRDQCMNGYVEVNDESCFYCPNKCNCVSIKNKVVQTILNQDYNCQGCINGLLINLVYQDDNNIPIYDCVDSCPTGYTQQDKSCVLCSSNCQSCQNISQCSTDNQCQNQIQCTECMLGYFLNSDGQCILKCGVGYYQDYQNRKCSKCGDINCTECPSLSFCDKCTNSYLYVNRCYTNCPQGYPDNNTNSCKSCLPNCASCQNGTTCSACISGTYLQTDVNGNIKCVSECNSGYYGSEQTNNKCVQCGVQNCNKCKQFNTCDSCTDTYYLQQTQTQTLLNACVNQCQLNYFANKITQECTPCPAACTNCPDGICDTCSQNYFLDQNKICISCGVNNCVQCKIQGKCDICDNQHYLKNGIECVSTCGSRYYGGIVNSANVCNQCIDNCLNCIDNNSCTQCDVGYYFATQSSLCQKCNILNCTTCTDSLSCQLCNTDYSLLEDTLQCVLTCPDGYFQNKTSSSNVCSKCNQNCKVCENNSQCKQCQDGYYLQLDTLTCVKVCASGYGIDEQNKQCFKCSTNCNTCSNIKDCQICNDGYFLDNTLSCIQCTTQNCKQCLQQPNICQLCKNPFYLKIDTSECLTDCPLVAYVQNNQTKECIKCPSNCNSCTLNINSYANNHNYNDTDFVCQKCNDSYFLNGNQNAQTLQPICQQCKSTCLECINNSSCTKCQKGMYLKYQDGSNSNGDCIECSKGCLDCIQKDTCSECQQPLKLNTDIQTCVQVCGQLTNGSQCDCSSIFQCIECSLTTKQCVNCGIGYKLQFNQNTSTNECIKICDEQKQLHPQGDKCISCSEKQYFDEDERQCKNCVEGCLECTVKDQCLEDKCDISYYFQTLQKVCIKCNIGEYIYNKKECKSCVKGCDVCQNEVGCDKCQNDLTFDAQLQMCIQICHSGSALCKCTDENCQKCNAVDSSCLQCMLGYQFQIINGQHQCQKIVCDQHYVLIDAKCIQCDSICESCTLSPTNCTTCPQGKEKVLIQGSNQEYTCKEQEVCHYTCNTCTNSQIDSCLTCLEDTRFLYFNRCICKEGFVENTSKECQKVQSDGKELVIVQSGLSSISVVSLVGGGSFASSLRGLEVSQMVSFLTYVNVEYEGKSDMYLKVLYSDNISPILPNVLSNIFQKNNNTSNASNNQTNQESSKRMLESQVFVDESQQTEYKFMKNSKTNNFVYNISPMILLHLFVAFLLMVKFCIFKYTKLQYSNKSIVKWVKHNFRMSIFLIIFYLTYQELLFIILLQLSKPFKQQPLSIAGSTLTLFTLLYVIYLLYFILRATIFMPYLTVKEKSQKFGALFYGLKETKGAQIFILVKIVQKTAICMCTVYGYTTEQVLPQLAISGVIFIFEIVVRPFSNKLIAVSSLTLNSLYLSLLVLSYFIKTEQHNLQLKQSYSSAYENLLLTFIIIKNLIVFIDIIVLIYGAVKIIRGIKNSEDEIDRTSTDLEGSLSKSITWRNNPLLDNIISVKLGKQEGSDLNSEFRSNLKRLDSSLDKNQSPEVSKQGSPNEKKCLVEKQSSPEIKNEQKDSEIQNSLLLGKETLIIQWKQNRLYKNENNLL